MAGTFQRTYQNHRGRKLKLWTYDFSLRDQFESFWVNVTSEAEKLAVDKPEQKRQRKVPARLVSGLAKDMPPESVEDYFRRIYLEAFDSIVNCIRDRFDQEGYKTYSKLQQLLLKTCNKQHVDEELLNFV
ncbi:hypothetical protein HOLleu_26331 [Holothuria leucospilota]|uniref:Uncharacterized protein n=1 Tax=Holothuria leucospilota TaxID=206669 RepID=A0A9Q1BT62_HOLLE|nr:hypothetical protein HOLleu_26331 [Holothuria leucospilota]